MSSSEDLPGYAYHIDETDAKLRRVEQFCTYQRKQRGKTEGGVTTYRWILDQFLTFVRSHEGRAAHVGDLTPETVRAWMDQMAEADLALSTIRTRQSTLSSPVRLARQAR